MENRCDICEKKFKRREDLQRHQVSHGPPKHTCDLCGYSSHRQDLMMKHRSSAAHRRRAGLQPPSSSTPRIECGVCGVKFTLQNNLDRHMREQHDLNAEREFHCHKCNQQFTRHANLVKHEEFGCPVNRVEQWGVTVSHRAPRSGVKRKLLEQEPQPGPSNEPQPGPSIESQPASVDNEDLTFVRMEVGFRDRLQTFRLQKPMPALRTIPEVLNDLLDRLVGLLRSAIEEHPNVKANLFLECEFADVTGEKTCVRAFKTKNTPLNSTSDLEHFVQRAFHKLMHEKEQCEMVGSGWTYLRVKNLEVRINRYHPLGGGRAYIPLPNSIAGTHGVINVQNRDDRCFAYAMLAKFVNVNPQRPESYTPDLFARYNWDGLNFPVAPKEIVKFERVNPHNSINVYALEEMYIKSEGSTRLTVYPLRTCRQELQDHTDLLYLTAKDCRSHYCYIKDLGRLVKPQLGTQTNRMYLCKRCFTHFDDRPNKLGLTGPQRLEEHRRYCGVDVPLRMDLASKTTIEFSHPEYSRKERFSVYADFECALQPTAKVPDAETPHGGTASHLHVPYAFCYHVHDTRGVACSTETYFGDDASAEFMRRLKRDAKKIKDLLYNERQFRPRLTHAEWASYNAATGCYLCGKQFVDGSKDVKVRDHNHAPPYEFRGAAHRSCNLRYREQRLINVYFHNLSNYDGHFIVRELGLDPGDVDVIAHTEERYISFTKRFVFDNDEAVKQQQKKKGITIRVRFVDSYRFLSSSLASLAAALPPEQLIETKKAFPNEGQFELVRRKGVFPYSYVTNYGVLGSTTELPPKEAFYNDLTLEHISNADYEHARNVWETFQCKSLEDYAAAYLQCDVTLLTDVFEQFRNTSLQVYGLDPVHYLTLPSYAWEVMLKLTNVKLDTIRDFDMYLFFEQGIRGGISQAITRYAKANHDRCHADDRVPEEPTRHVMYFDANNLYGWAMSKPLPTSDLEWLNKEEIKALNIPALDPDGLKGYVLEVDLRYPEDLHDLHKDLPYCCETRRPPKGNFKKLLTTLDDKDHYICHFRILQQALLNGLELTAIHRVVRFTQSRWLETYILKNTELRKRAKTKFEQDYFKLMNNAVFGKTIENVRKRLDVQLVCNPERFSRLVAKPNFLDRTYYGDDVALVHLAKVRIVLEKPIYVGMCVLELSKWLMYDFLHKMKERYGDRLEVDYMDTDSFIFTITTEDVYRDMMAHLDDFDTSGYPKNHPCYSPVNTKVIGKFKDECNGLPLLEYLGLRSKLYFLDIYNDNDDDNDSKTYGPSPPKRIKTVKKAKGIAKGVVEHLISPDDYRDCLFGGVIKRTVNTRFQSHLHRVYTVQVEKLSMSSSDDKRYILPDGIHTLPWGHKDIPNREGDNRPTDGDDDENL